MMAIKVGLRQKEVKGKQSEEDQKLLAGERRIDKEESLEGRGEMVKKTKSSFLSLPFLVLVAANPPAVLGHYTVYMFLPAVSSFKQTLYSFYQINSMSETTNMLLQLCEEKGLADAHLLISILGLANTLPRWRQDQKSCKYWEL